MNRQKYQLFLFFTAESEGKSVFLNSVKKKKQREIGQIRYALKTLNIEFSMLEL